MTPADLITAGAVDLGETEHAQKVTAVKFILHPDYGTETGKNDLALIKLKTCFHFNKNISAIEFDDSAWPSSGKRQCYAVGFGRTERGSTNNLKALEIEVKHGTKSCPCIDMGYQLKRVLCLPNVEEGICFGDSGGGLNCDGKLTGIAHVVMDKRGCSILGGVRKYFECESKEIYGMYMYTCPYLDWISGHIPGVPGTPKSCKASNTVHKYTILMSCLAICFVNYLFHK